MAFSLYAVTVERKSKICKTLIKYTEFLDTNISMRIVNHP